MSSHSEDLQCVDLLERTASDLQALNALILSAGSLAPEHVTALQVLFMRRELIERAIESGTLSGEVADLADRVADRLHDQLPEMFYMFCHRLNVDAVISANDGTASDAANVFDSDGWRQVWWRLGAAAGVGLGSHAPWTSDLAQTAAAETGADFVDADYAEPNSKADLAFLFGLSVRTLTRRIKSGELRAHPGTAGNAKKIRLHGDDFPDGLRRPHERKQRLKSRKLTES